MSDIEYEVCIIGGLGHVGLPLGIAFASKRKNVVLYDINEEATTLVRKGVIPFMEEGAETALAGVINQTLYVSTDPSVISKAKYIIITIGTPVDEHLNPNLKQFTNCIADLKPYLRDGQHVVLRSTIYPGITEKARDMLLESGRKLSVSFCPERIAEGKALKELAELPQIVSGFDRDSLREARELFQSITEDVIELEPLEAELAKLYTNTWRYLQFAISNYFYQLSTQNNVDFYKIFHAIKHKYPRAQNFPAPGFAAGPCLFKDTMQLASYSNSNFFMGHAAMLVNEGLPNFIVQRLKERGGLKNKTVGILGMAFKANNDDKRESLAYKLRKLFTLEARRVLCSDAYIEEQGFISAQEVVAAADIVVLATPHAEYAQLTIAPEKHLVDVWNFFGKGGLF
ncbi:nucleotide sugar dehydrogenase [Geomonas propionica]|uniref:Nucleotide sugar dehydrogenase n=1 Tax=Geomonas propionica TaxID=2798582 RepID=A0ABS0YT74_9BACT|nr:nucleotide sugar dehydrogenase [Geomonas propionica]MBJ6801177.1 nucleotide sugar dehydrogenase [Geomonas propionica]